MDALTPVYDIVGQRQRSGCAGRPNLRRRPHGFPDTPYIFSRRKSTCQGISRQEKHGSYWGLPDMRLEDDARPGPPLVDVKRSSRCACFLLAVLRMVAVRGCLDDRLITHCSRGRSCDSGMRR
jgi:hypothetical protein